MKISEITSSGKTVKFHVTADANRLLRPAVPGISPSGRIVGGEDATIEEIPWQASLQNYGFSFCGASIVAEEWVLTAAHCTSYSADSITVKVGSTLKNKGGSSHQAMKIVRHEEYTTNKYGIPLNDVALIKVEKPFKLDNTRQPVPLFDYLEDAVEGTLTVITGWGAIREGGSTSEVLQKVSVPVVSKTACSDAYLSYGGVPEGQICAAYPRGGKDACQGDSGGPLTIGGRLAGIVSWGNGCARPGYPGVYTEVATYRNWIVEKIEL